MTTSVLFDQDHPHGSTQGFQLGCRSSQCPAPITCREAHTRYQGDYAFRKAIDAGMSAADIHERERPSQPEAVKRAAPRRERRTPSTAFHKQVAELVEQGYTDRQVADALGKTRDQASSTRTYLGIPANYSSPRTPATAGVSSS